MMKFNPNYLTGTKTICSISTWLMRRSFLRTLCSTSILNVFTSCTLLVITHTLTNFAPLCSKWVQICSKKSAIPTNSYSLFMPRVAVAFGRSTSWNRLFAGTCAAQLCFIWLTSKLSRSSTAKKKVGLEFLHSHQRLIIKLHECMSLNACSALFRTKSLSYSLKVRWQIRLKFFVLIWKQLLLEQIVN